MKVIPLKKNKFLLRYRDENGKQREKIINGSKSAANAMACKIENEVYELRLFPEKKLQRILFKDIAQKYWLIHGKTTKSAEKLIYQYNKIVEYFKDKQAHQITTEDIQIFYNYMSEKDSPSTANHYLATIKAIFNKADKLGIYTGRNPCKGVDKKENNPPREKYLTKEEIRKIITEAPARLKPIIACALMTGMRRGEILNLDWQDINFETNIIYIHTSKSGKQRKIPMISSLKNVFLQLGPQKTGKIFSISTPAFRFAIRKYLNTLGLEDFRFHDLRHSFASLFESETSQTMALQEIMGHSNANLTKRYTHLSSQHLTKSINTLDPFFEEIINPKESLAKNSNAEFLLSKKTNDTKI